MATLNGTSASDHLTGGADAELLHGRDGDDWLEGVGGGDTLYGDQGDDDLEGGVGNDFLYGGSGFDYLVGGQGNDVIDGGSTQDPGAPKGWGEFDTVSYYDEGGTQGVKVNLATGKATDSFGDTDLLKNIERAVGTIYSDTLTGGNAANDSEAFVGYAGADTISGGAGFDSVEYYFDKDAGGDQGIVANLLSGTILDGFRDRDAVKGIEEVRGTSHSDSFIGSNLNDVFMPFGGNDLINGGKGVDTVAYNIDVWRDGKLGIVANLAKNFIVDCNSAVDRITSIENVRGSFWDDIISGSGFGNELRGYEGADTLRGRGGADSLYGGFGNDTIYGGAGNDYIEGWTGTDTLRGGAGRDYFGVYANSDTDIILDFRSGEDKLDVRDFNFTSKSAVLNRLTIVSSSTAVLELPDDTFVEFHNVNTHGVVLTADDLII